MNNSFAYLTIASWDGVEKYKLTFGVDDGTPYMPSLEFTWKGKEEYWDSEEYLDRLDKTIQYLLGKDYPADVDCLRDVREFGLNNDLETLGEMFDRAILLGVWSR